MAIMIKTIVFICFLVMLLTLSRAVVSSHSSFFFFFLGHVELILFVEKLLIDMFAPQQVETSYSAWISCRLTSARKP